MTKRQAQLAAVFETTPLAGREGVELALPGTTDVVVAYEVPVSETFEFWTAARERTEVTGHWPVLTLVHANLREADLFSRFYFEEEQRHSRSGDEPVDIISASLCIDVDLALQELPEDDSISLEELIEIGVAETQKMFGMAPVIPNVPRFLRQHNISDPLSVERWLFEWELAHCEGALALPEHGLAHLQWFEHPSDEFALLLFPSIRHWEVPAYVNWYASTRCNSHLIVALLRQWHLEFGAELVAHYGTMLQFVAKRRPATPQEAFRLAGQQHLIAPCTTLLPGVSVRNHARALMNTDRWFLHERP